ncbi:cytochrome P450 [Catenuloplanes atrovinosus]|uniref:Oxidation protein CepF/oxidation protein CepG n=1 Tax=Catenuloplanes atrovinosus TaxID=137266 RepID=A0AAE3YNV2_9ACTN|nr:cytochrome P450 [Catenuloplanes atrovinosus]MDR7276965.1 oxidation protein CepF/oxidation protein CepG [Catenuloplanes atrovinosus]
MEPDVDEAAPLVEPSAKYMRRTGCDPHEDMFALRAHGPLIRITGGAITQTGRDYVWQAMGYDVVRRIIGDHENFSTRPRVSDAEPAGGEGVPVPPEVVGQIGAYDPPEHTRLRRMLTPEFTVRRIRRLEPAIQALIDECLDEVEAEGPPADVQVLFADPVGGGTLCELLGIPRDDRTEFIRRVRQNVDLSRGYKARAADSAAFNRYLNKLITAQRKDPDEGFIGMLVREHGADVTDEELKGVCTALVLGGVESVAGMLGYGILALLENPGQRRLLFAGREEADRLVNELLRYLSAIQQPTPRMAVRDVVVDGQLIRAGDMVLCSILMANRDEALTPEPNTLDASRAAAPHLAFGHGIHHCIGAAVARAVLRMAYQSLWRRFPGLSLAVPADSVRLRRAFIDSPDRLPVTW